ncbi:hypothetical protein JXQ70_05960 [bacterium]|nr:hypothetical protein [bacterium]
MRHSKSNELPGPVFPNTLDYELLPAHYPYDILYIDIKQNDSQLLLFGAGSNNTLSPLEGETADRREEGGEKIIAGDSLPRARSSGGQESGYLLDLIAAIVFVPNLLF